MFIGGGNYSKSEKEIEFSFFETEESHHQLNTQKSDDGRVDIDLQVLRARDSIPIPLATIYGRDTSKQVYNFVAAADSLGRVQLKLSDGKTLKYLRIYLEFYVDEQIRFPESYDQDYSLVIYLKEDCHQTKNYAYQDPEKVVRVGLKRKHEFLLGEQLYKRKKRRRFIRDLKRRDAKVSW